MSKDRFLLDTVFVQALLNHRDQYHAQARKFFPRLRTASEIWTTEAILVEIGNALSASYRMAATRFIQQCYHTPNIHVVSVDTLLFSDALHLYQSRKDKTWGLTDCISFIVMQKERITDAVTADEHFRQAGYHALLLG